MAVTTKYTVKVPLDLGNTPGENKGVIWDETAKKFDLGAAGAGAFVINFGTSKITVSNTNDDEVVAQDYFRYVGGGSGTSQGKVAIGNATQTTPFQKLDIGTSISPASGFGAQALFYNTNNSQDSYLRGTRIGLDQFTPDYTGAPSSIVGILATSFGGTGDDDVPLIIGKYRGHSENLSINSEVTINENGRVGIGIQEDPVAAFQEDTPVISTYSATAKLEVGEDSNDPNLPAARITNFNDNKQAENVTLELRLGATEGYANESQGFPPFYYPDKNAKFVSFKRRKSSYENTNSPGTPNFVECGKIILDQAIGANDPPGVIYGNTSDKRLKKNVKTLSIGLNELLKIQPSEYNWISSPSSSVDIGFLAQDLYEIYPKAVYKPHDETDLSDPWAIDYGKLTPLLVKSIQDQQKIIEDLKKRITKLENLI